MKSQLSPVVAIGIVGQMVMLPKSEETAETLEAISEETELAMDSCALLIPPPIPKSWVLPAGVGAGEAV